MIHRVAFSVATWVLSAALYAAPTAPSPSAPQANPELQSLTDQDQAARAMPYDKIDWTKVGPADAERRKRALSILQAGAVRTSTDYYNIALIYQHGDGVEDIRFAYALATVATRIDPGNHPARWLMAAAWDRILMRSGKPQWYGTQYLRNKATRKWELYPVESGAVSDDERKSYGVPTLDEARARADKMD